MSKRLVLAILLLVAVIGTLAWIVLRPSEPSNGGKTLSQWIDQYAVNFGDGGPVTTEQRIQTEQAQAAIQKMGPAALPLLVEWAGVKDSTPVRQLRVRVLTTLMGTKPKSAAYYRATARWGLVALGQSAKPAVPAMVALLGDADPGVRSDTAFALGQMSSVAEAAVPRLIQSLNDPQVRNNSIVALGRIRSQPELSVPTLSACLSGRGGKTWALQALANFGPDAKSAVPSILPLLNDANPGLRMEAGRALKAIDPEAAVKAGIE